MRERLNVTARGKLTWDCRLFRSRAISQDRRDPETDVTWQHRRKTAFLYGTSRLTPITLVYKTTTETERVSNFEEAVEQILFSIYLLFNWL